MDGRVCRRKEHRHHKEDRRKADRRKADRLVLVGWVDGRACHRNKEHRHHNKEDCRKAYRYNNNRHSSKSHIHPMQRCMSITSARRSRSMS